MSEEDDVPPLEDLTEQVLRAKARRAPGKEPRMRSDAREKSEAERDDQKTFGGFSKGFLLSGPTSSQRRQKSPPNTATKEKATSAPQRVGETASSQRRPKVEERQTDGDEDMPFLRQRDVRDKGPVFPEVQEAMKEAYPLLNTEEWMTESLLEKIEKHPLLSKALRDPNLSRVLSQFQSDPRSVLQAASGNPEMQSFLREFCSLMGSHFTELADKHDSKQSPAEAGGMDEGVQRVLGEKGVKEALSDPEIQHLVRSLKEDSRKAQKILSSASPELRQKIQLLVDNGVLAIQ